MKNLTDLTNLLKNFKIYPQKIEPLKGDGSNRIFFRLFFKHSSLILILPQKNDFGLKEAKIYYELGNFFYKNNIPVPKIKFWEPNSGILIVEDLGNTNLCNISNPLPYYYKVIEILNKIQKLASSFPTEKTLDTPFYNFNFLWEKEVNYFFNWYLKNYKNLELSSSFIDEFFNWAKEKSNFCSQVVMHRDFQSKNLMIKDGKIFVIDFQGARLGPPSYDLASLLLDPYVDHFEDLNTLYTFLDYYLYFTKYPTDLFLEEFKFLGIVRLMQALAAYCKLSKAGKEWFTKYIPIAEKRLFKLVKIFYPEIYKLFYTLKK
ncbi:MAG: phosphotransferase [Thermodesulfobacterium sp.]|nr:phosphotransferase [Thermodesulfobacterium sp.]